VEADELVLRPPNAGTFLSPCRHRSVLRARADRQSVLLSNDPASPGLAGSHSGLTSPQVMSRHLFARALSSGTNLPLRTSPAREIPTEAAS
jgi:hypothetical protein